MTQTNQPISIASSRTFTNAGMKGVNHDCNDNNSKVKWKLLKKNQACGEW